MAVRRFDSHSYYGQLKKHALKKAESYETTLARHNLQHTDHCCLRIASCDFQHSKDLKEQPAGNMQTDKLIEWVKETLDDRKARDIVTLDVRDKSNVTDFMVIASGSSNRHVKSVAEHLMVEAKKGGIETLGIEGLDTAEWALVDLGDVVVHVMQPEARALYDLERLWGTEAVEQA